MDIILTNHAIERAYERFGWDRDKLMSMSIKAVSHGMFMLHDDVLRPMWLNISLCKRSIPYMVDGVVFVFTDNIVRTVYPLNGRF